MERKTSNKSESENPAEEIKKLKLKVRRLQRRIRVLESMNDSGYSRDGRRLPHSEGEFA